MGIIQFILFFKPATSLRIPGLLNGGLILALRIHSIGHKPKEEDPMGSASSQRMKERTYLINAQSKHFT